MFAGSPSKVYFILVILIGLTQKISAEEPESQDDSKFKYGYVISHKGGSTQAHVESRDGEMALGRYYVNHPNGSGQKVTYFADDLGFHTGVSYTNRLGTGSSKTEIAMGEKAIAALSDFDVAPSGILAASTAAPLHGIKISQKILEFETGKSPANSFGKLSYPPSPLKGFYLTQKPLEDTTKSPILDSEYSGQSTVNLNDEIQLTTPALQTFLKNNFQNNDSPGVKTVPSFVNQKSIEKTHFNNEETHLILEVQKHAESIIRKDLSKGLPLRFQNDNKKYQSTPKPITTVTMQPIVITNNGINNIQDTVSSTFAPEVKKLVKDFYSDSINSLKITEKNSKDQALEDSAHFKISLSPSFVSSINSSQSSQALLDVNTENRNLSNSKLCKSNLCYISNDPTSYSDSPVSIKPKKDIGIGPDINNVGASQRVTQTFYPENQIMMEKHYITTIDVQKGIPLNVKQMEDGSIRLANSFESNKLSSFKQPYIAPTVKPISSNFIFVTPSSRSSIDDVYFTTTNDESYTANTVTQSPAVLDVTPKSHLYPTPNLKSSFQSISSYQNQLPTQNQIPTNNLGHETQQFQTVSPEPQYSSVTSNSLQNIEKVPGGIEELRELQKNIQELRQKIINDLDAKHEEEQKQQKFVENERKQYLENLKKVEEVKDQKPIVNYNTNFQSAPANIPIQSSGIQEQNISPVSPVPPVPPVISVTDNSVQGNYVPAAPNNAYVNPVEISHTPIAAYSNQQIQSPVIYQQPIISYTTQGYQTIESQNERKFLETASLQNSYVSQPPPTSQNIQISNFLQAPPASNFVTQSEVKPQYVQDLNFFSDHSNTLSYNSEPQLLAQESNVHYLSGTSPLVSTIIPYDYNTYYDTRDSLSYLNNYQVQVPAESQQIPVSTTYQFPQPVLSQVLTYPENPPLTSQQYHVTLSRPDALNKLRIQPLKPSPPAESTQEQSSLSQVPQPQIVQPQSPQAQVAQAQAVQAQVAQIPQNLLPPSQFQQTYFFPSFPSNNRLHLRHVKKNRNLNSDQVASQSQPSLTRKGKSLSNLRIEYGFKPPLRPSVEYTEEVKPSIYGPSTRPE